VNQKLKLYAFGICFWLLLSLSQSLLAAAHDLEENNGMVAALHVEPDDKPVVGASNKLELLFSKNVGGFQMDNYTIKLRVAEHGKQLQEVSVTPEFYGAADKGTASVTFPKIDTYQLVLTGTPKSQTDQSFIMTYPLSVVSSANKSNAGIEWLLACMTAIVVACLSVVMFKKR